MKKKIIILVLCCITFGLTACSSGNKEDHELQMESDSMTGQINEKAGNISEEQSTADTGVLTQEQALVAIKKYCFINNPELEKMADSNEYSLYWDVTTNEAKEIVVLYRAYTGAEIRYYVDPVSGETYSTEFVPGIIDDEQRTDEEFNVTDYLD